MFFSVIGLWDGAKRSLPLLDFVTTACNQMIVLQMATNSAFSLPARHGTEAAGVYVLSLCHHVSRSTCSACLL